MNKSYIVEVTDENMRLDRFLRNKLGKIPQSLIEKYLRAGKIKLNKKKVLLKMSQEIEKINYKTL